MGGSASFLSQVSDGLSIAIRVIPRAGVTKISGVRADRLLVRLAAAPVDGAANEALVAFLSKTLGVPSRQIAIAAGQKGRNKTVIVTGVSLSNAEKILIGQAP